MNSFWGRLKFVFSSVCQASMITFVGFLQRITPYATECQISPYGSRTPYAEPIRYSVNAAYFKRELAKSIKRA